jgi:hypothetical protein
MNGVTSDDGMPEATRRLLRSVLGDLPDRFPEDVDVAWRTAEALKALPTVPADVTVEPWPPMRTKGG